MAAIDKAKAKEQALQLAFEGRWSHSEMAERVGVSTRTIERWTTAADFKARLAALRDDFAASILAVTYADKARRIIALDAMAESARREYEARPWLQEVRPSPNGDVINESFNNAAHAAFRGALDDIAKELGARKQDTNATAQMVVVAVAADVLDAI